LRNANGQYTNIQSLTDIYTNHVQTIIAVQTHLPPATVPIGQAFLIFLQTFGGAFFLAISQTLFNSSLVEALRKYAGGVNAQAVIVAGASGVRDAVSAQDLPSVLRSYNEAVNHEFYMSAACSALTLLTCMGMGWKKIVKEKKKIVAPPAVAIEEPSSSDSKA
jgi:hypothetical protein